MLAMPDMDRPKQFLVNYDGTVYCSMTGAFQIVHTFKLQDYPIDNQLIKFHIICMSNS